MIFTSNPFILKEGTVLDSAKGGQGLSHGSYSYEIVESLKSQAAHGFSYRAKIINRDPSDPEFAFIKTPKIDPEQTSVDLTKRIAHIEETFRREILKKDRLAGIPNVSQYLSVGSHQLQDSIAIPFLAQQFIEGPPLDAYLLNREETESGVAAFTGLHDIREWFALAISLVTTLKRLHNQQIVHGDIAPRNIIITSKSPLDPVLVDFGQSFLIDEEGVRARPAGETPHVVSAYRSPEREARQWQIPADIYSVGGVLYFLATGAPPPASIKSPEIAVEVLKSDIASGIDRGNRSLRRLNEGIVKIIDKCLRRDPHDRYPAAENILTDLDTFRFEANKPQASQERLGTLLEHVKSEFSHIENPFFANILAQNLEIIERQSAALKKGHFEVVGHRDQIIDSVCRYLSALKKGDEYLTVTQPLYWTKNNLGTNGRFFTMNKLMASRGVIIRRVFMLSKSDLQVGSPASKILTAHIDAAKELSADGIEVLKKDIPYRPGPDDPQRSFYTGFTVCDEHYRRSYFENEGNHVALWCRKDSREMMAIMFSTLPDEHDPNQEQIVKVRFWTGPTLNNEYAKLTKHILDSQPISSINHAHT